MPFTQVCIFGDSLSDMGRIAHQAIGVWGRGKEGATALPTTHRGRFSNGKIWVDYLWEKLGGQSMYDDTSDGATWVRSKPHKSLWHSADNGSGISLANYSVGGATISGSSSKGIPWTRIGDKVKVRALYSLNDMIQEYKSDLRALEHNRTGIKGLKDKLAYERRSGPTAWARQTPTLFIIILGANDLVTVHRSRSGLRDIHYGIGLGLKDKVDKLRKPPSTVGDRFVLALIPDLSQAPRLLAGGDPYWTNLPDLASATHELNLGIYDACDRLEHANVPVSLMDLRQLPSLLQAQGVDVRSVAQNRTRNSDNADWGTISDLLHPTTRAHKILFKEMWKTLKPLLVDTTAGQGPQIILKNLTASSSDHSTLNVAESSSSD